MTKHFFEYYNNTILNHWDASAISDFDGEKEYTYGQMATEITRLQLLLNALGIRRGDKVAICSRNCANWAISFLSICANRGVVVSIMDAFTGEGVENLVNHSDAKALFVGQSVWTKVDIKKMPNLSVVLSVENFSLLFAKTDELTAIYDKKDQLFQVAYPNGYTRQDVDFPTDNLDDLMIINYTSGTSSEPKGVMLTYRNISANVQYSQETIPNSVGDNEVCMLPLSHMFGLVIEFIYQVAGGCHVHFLSKTPTPSVLLKAFKEVKPYMILTVPLVLEKIFKAKIFPALEKPVVKFLWNTPLLCKIVEKKIYEQLMEAFGGNLRWLITGGAAINQDVESVFRRIKFPFVVGYGMTECGPLICYDHPQNEVLGCCGKVVTRNELKINSEDPQHTVGEILVRGEHVMLGYYKNEEATNAAIDKNGWLHTGDLGVMDSEGRLFIKGRSKAMILSSNGQNVYPEEIEDKLNNLPAVVESVVVGRKGKIVALVFPDTEYLKKNNLSVEQQMADNLIALNKKLPQYEQVAKIELVDKEFEKTPKRSIRRFLYN